MTKKNKTKAKSTPRPTPQVTEVTDAAEEIVAPAESPQPRAPRAPKLSRSQIAAERIEDEYAYITDDLRRVFILAGLIFALMIVLNLVFQAMG